MQKIYIYREQLWNDYNLIVIIRNIVFSNPQTTSLFATDTRLLTNRCVKCEYGLLMFNRYEHTSYDS